MTPEQRLYCAVVQYHRLHKQPLEQGRRQARACLWYYVRPGHRRAFIKKKLPMFNWPAIEEPLPPRPGPLGPLEPSHEEENPHQEERPEA